MGGFFFEVQETNRIRNEFDEAFGKFRIPGQSDLEDIVYPANDGTETVKHLIMQLVKMGIGTYEWISKNMGIRDYIFLVNDNKLNNYCEYISNERYREYLKSVKN